MFSLQFFKKLIIPACNILAFYISYNEFKDGIIPDWNVKVNIGSD